jgi:preprotein translocase subunit SecE
MGVEAKRMAKSIVASADDNSLAGRLKSWPERLKNFYNDVRTEMKKVTAPSFKEVQATTVVVIVTVFLFAGYFWIVDMVLGKGIDQLFRYFTHPH